jgi:hypothetical protein
MMRDIIVKGGCVSLLLIFYLVIAICLVRIIHFESAWDKGIQADYPEECRGLIGDTTALVGLGVTGVLIIIMLIF